jgi:signal transduction histidine kinase
MIAITAMAVFLSNVAVAVWFELGSQRLNETAMTERTLDRAASVATLMSSIPAKTRPEAVHALSSPLWSFQLLYGNGAPRAMNEEETHLAARLKAMLPEKDAKSAVSVNLNPRLAPEDSVKTKHRSPGGSVLELVLPVVPGTQLKATFFRPPSPPWPAEITTAGIVAILVASFASAYLARRMARPLSELAAAASVAARGGEAPHVREDGPDDVRKAAIAFNAMTNQVKRTLESQRQLLSAVGHDLRTPITAMRINLEFVEDTELRERLQKNLDELQDLTEAVLSASRGTGGETKRNVDLSALVESLCADLDDIGEPVTWNAHSAAPLSCRPNEVRRAVRNLVENAVAYGHVASVRLAESPAAYEIIVEDEGPGIPDEDRERVFEPFVRLETSRNEDTGGTGLGLTLVKAIAEGHGGGVTLENRDDGGLRARMRLPREGASA